MSNKCEVKYIINLEFIWKVFFETESQQIILRILWISTRKVTSELFSEFSWTALSYSLVYCNL